MFKEENLTKNNEAKNNDLEILKTHFSHCFDKNGDFDFDKFKAEISKNEIDFSKESYGMDWLGKSYARVLASEPSRTLLKEDKDWNKKEENKNSENILIKGDNLEVLKHLSNAYHNKIKMIYIDPPYNTGSDGFVYQDDRKFDIKEFSKLAGVDEEKSKRILDFVDSKSNSHSAWLTFMYPRLYIAKQLLKDDGVIFVSIDDNEVAQLRILMDEIFGEENFEGHIHWRRRHNQPNDKTKMIGLVAEHILVFSKNSSYLKKIGVGKIGLTGNFSNPDNDPLGPWASKPWKIATGKSGSKYKIELPSGRIIDGEWAGTEKTYLEALENNRMYFPKNGDGEPRKKYYSFEREEEGQSANNWFSHLQFGSNQEGSEYLNNIFGIKDIFDGPKPCKLIKSLIQIGNVINNEIVLDFFGGSGTTGDAVMQLNSEDGGNRKFILAQIPELIDKEKSKIAYDFVKNELGIETPTIFEITKERLIRAAKKIQEDNVDKKVSTIKEKCEYCNKETSVKLPEQSAKDLSNIDFGFKIFETTPIWEDYNVESEEFSEKLKLFDETKLKDDDVQTLLTTWKTSDNIALTQDLEEIDLDGYISYYFEDKIYLMNKGFETKNLKALLEKIDSDKTFEPKTIIAFGYHFESKNLREIAENIKAYSNKKNIDIDFITRY